MRVGECTVRGMRWLLGVGRRWGKRLSSVVVYLDHPVVVQGNSVWFGGALHPVEQYVFGIYWGGTGGCGYVCVVVLCWALMYHCCFFLAFVSFIVHGSGLFTSFYVTSLYIDAALLGGA